MKYLNLFLEKYADGAPDPEPTGSANAEPQSTLAKNGNASESGKSAEFPHFQPTAPERIELANECAAILATFGNAAAMTKRGNWKLHGTRYSHAQALAVAQKVLAERNGQAVPMAPGKYFDAGAAFRDFELLSGCEVIAIQAAESTLMEVNA